MLTVVPGAADADKPRRDGGSSLIDELVREGARRMLAEALQAEVDDYIARFVAERDEHGRRLVVRNGTHQPREVLTSAGAVEVTVPRTRPPRAAGARSTPRTWSRSSAPAPPSRAASSANDPTTTTNRKPPKRSSSTGLDYCSRCAATRTVRKG